MITVRPSAHRGEDRAGDPLDGLVNLFDLGIVLSVAFLLAALSSLHLGAAITRHGLRATPVQEIQIKPGQKVAPLPTPGGRTIGRGTQAGVVYRLSDGQLVYVQNAPRAGVDRRARALMAFLWHELRASLPLIGGGDGYILDLLWVTIRVAVISTAAALVIGLPVACALGLGRFRGRRALHVLANASLALPPILAGLGVLLLVLPRGVLGAEHLAFTLGAVYIAQTVLALPYVVALGAAAIQALPGGLFDQARALGAGRLALAGLALREARIGVLAAVIAALGSALSEVGAVVIVGGNIQNQDQTLASAVLQQINDYASYSYAVGIGIVLLVLVLALTAALTLLQQRDAGVRLRFRTQ